MEATINLGDWVWVKLTERGKECFAGSGTWVAHDYYKIALNVLMENYVSWKARGVIDLLIEDNEIFLTDPSCQSY